MFRQEVGESGTGQFLKALARFARDGLDRLQRFVIELDTLSGHADSLAPKGLRCREAPIEHPHSLTQRDALPRLALNGVGNLHRPEYRR